LQELEGVISGNIRVATIYSIGLHVLPPYVKRFLKDYPTVNVHVEYRGPAEVYEDVLGHVVDLGLVAYPVRDARLETVPLHKERMVLACHPQHPLAKLATVKLKALAGQKFVSFTEDTPTRKALDKVFREHGVTVEHVMEFDNIETVKRAVEIDSGVAIVPLVTIGQEVAKRTLAAVAVEGGDLARPLAAIYKKNRVLSPAMKQFLELLRQDL
jgi:DNA-binding transcriptional LysR family regulator